MCGITGIVKLNPQHDLVLPAALQKMTELIRHRGPDGEGYVLGANHQLVPAFGKETDEQSKFLNLSYSPKQSIENVPSEVSIGLGHRRLSIIDLSPAGHQPMCNSSQTYWITYNGEIYNYIELREELKAKGYNFYTATDTEVILKAYEEWGYECVQKFNGMWAFVIYDTTQQIVFGSRDRFGVKPFYYTINKNFFAFASEQKSLIRSEIVQPKINYEAVFDFFVLSITEVDETGMFSDVLELQPSNNFILSIKENKFEKWRYYSLPINLEFKKFDKSEFEKLSLETRDRVVASVKLRMRSDVPIGSCLSGGIDSSSIVGIMNHLLENNGKKLDLFTASFNHPKIDESKWAKKVVDNTNSQWHQSFPNGKGLKADLEDLIYCQDIPIWSTSTYAQFSVMKLARENGVKVILDGQGGDELWAGYPHHMAVFIKDLIQHGGLKEAIQLASNCGPFPKNIAWLLKQYMKHTGLVYYPKAMLPKFYLNNFEHLKFLSSDFFNHYKHRIVEHHEKATSSLNDLLYKETTETLLKGYLKCEDRCSMWHSVESRTPFADDVNLIEIAFQTPSTLKYIRETVNTFSEMR